MADIRKRTGRKGTTYQVRYASKAAKGGYAYATFATLKEARDFLESGEDQEAQGAAQQRKSRPSTAPSRSGSTSARKKGATIEVPCPFHP